MTYEEFDFEGEETAHDEELAFTFKILVCGNRSRLFLKKAKRNCTREFSTYRISKCRLWNRQEADGSCIGSGALISVKGHTCIVTSNHVIPRGRARQGLSALFIIESDEAGSDGGTPDDGDQDAGQRPRVPLQQVAGFQAIHRKDAIISIRLQPEHFS